MATPLFPTFDKRISDSVNALITAQVIPWSFLTDGSPFRVKRFDGSEISYQGVTFDGSPQHVFWSGYIEPFLEDMVVRELALAVQTCKERNVDALTVLPELQGLLIYGCHKVFNRMADVDRKLRGKGYPNSVPLRPIKGELERMQAFIHTHVSVDVELWKLNSVATLLPDDKESPPNSWHKRNPFWVWLIGSPIAAGIALGLGLRQKPQVVVISPATAPTSSQQTPSLKASERAPHDPLQAAIDEFKRYDLDNPSVDVAVEKENDPQYMAIWNRKMRMLGTIEDLAKSLHREKEVESFIALKNNTRVESNAAPLKGKQPRRVKPTL